MRYLLILAFTISFGLTLQAGEYQYKWTLGKQEVGKVVVSVSEEDGKNKIEYKSELEVNVGEKVVIKDIFRNEFLNDSLVNVGVARYFNDKPRITIIENFENNKLSRTINGTNKSIERSVQEFTYSKLFVEAPKNVTSLYYEIYGKMFSITETKENVFVLSGPNDRNERFTYDEKGNLVSAEVESNFGTFILSKD